MQTVARYPNCVSPYLQRALLATAMVCLTACSAPLARTEAPTIALPMRMGWIDGVEVRYVTTDVSDPKLALDQGANYSSRLADAALAPAGHSLLERVYKVVNFEQRPVFQSAPKPVGATSIDVAYSPLWRLTLVTWKKLSEAKELRSEQQILEAEDRGWIHVEVSNLVLNCPILYVQGRGQLPGVSW